MNFLLLYSSGVPIPILISGWSIREDEAVVSCSTCIFGASLIAQLSTWSRLYAYYYLPLSSSMLTGSEEPRTTGASLMGVFGDDDDELQALGSGSLSSSRPVINCLIRLIGPKTVTLEPRLRSLHNAHNLTFFFITRKSQQYWCSNWLFKHLAADSHVGLDDL